MMISSESEFFFLSELQRMPVNSPKTSIQSPKTVKNISNNFLKIMTALTLMEMSKKKRTGKR